ncbi:MAG: hypothetical protein ACK56I_20510 [bacterium]
MSNSDAAPHTSDAQFIRFTQDRTIPCHGVRRCAGGRGCRRFRSQGGSAQQRCPGTADDDRHGRAGARRTPERTRAVCAPERLAHPHP